MPPTKLSREQVAEIFLRTKNGERVARLAREFGVNRGNLAGLLHRRFVVGVDGFWKSTVTLPDNPVVIAYIAGLFDGEGSIVYRGDGHIGLSIKMTHFGVIRWLGKVGGGIHSGGPVRGNRKPCLSWCINRRRDVVLCLEAMLPYLIVKRALAKKTIKKLKLLPKHNAKER